MSERPNVVTGLAPDSPTLKTLDTVSVQAPYHSIIGNRGRPNGPAGRSSRRHCGIWVRMAKAQSEVIVPGPHRIRQLSANDR